MQLMRRSILRNLVLILAVALSACGKKSRSQNVQLFAIPTEPIVFSSDVSIIQNGTATTEKGPWFKLQVAVDNQDTTDSVTIEALHLQVFSTLSGQPTTNTVDFDPSADSLTLNNSQCTFSDFGQFDPNGQNTNGSYNNVPLYESSSGTGCPGHAAVVFYVTGNPAPPAPTTPGAPIQTNYNYRVLIQPEGWFGTREQQVDRFTRYIYISTQ